MNLNFCPNKASKEYRELASIFGDIKAYFLWMRNKGNHLDKAPNGAESKLFNTLLEEFKGDRTKALKAKAKVYSNDFLNWFGDWINGIKNPYSNDITLGDISMDFDSADRNGAGAIIGIKKNNEVIGSIALNAYYRSKDKFEPWGKEKDKYVSMSSVGDNVEIDEKERGKGYGKAAYFEMAKKAIKQGLILTSAPDNSRTEDSTRVWKALERDGYVKKVGNRYEFIDSFLTDVSKVVDENGEPLVVWHGSNSGGILVFDKNKIGSNTDLGIFGKGFYFSPRKSYARTYGDILYPVFLNIKNPITNVIDSDIIGRTVEEISHDLDKSYHSMYERMIQRGKTDEEAKSSAERHRNAMAEYNSKYERLFLENHDGGIFFESTTNKIKPSEELAVVINSNQIKSALSNKQDIIIEEPGFSTEDDNIYHNLRDEDGNYEDEVPPAYEPYIDEESAKWFQRMYQLLHEFEDLKRERIELNKQIKEANSDTISKLIVITKSGKIKFVEKPNHYVKIDNDASIFGLVSTGVWFKNDTIDSALLFPSKHVVRPDVNYYRIENSIRDNTTRIVYEALSVLKNHGKKVVYSPWKIVSSGIISEPENASVQILRMEKVLGIKLSDFVSSEETVVDDYTPFGKKKARYYRIAFNIDSMLNRLSVMGHNLEIYNILNKVYEQKPISIDNSLLISGLTAKEKEIDEKLSLIQEEIRSLEENIRRKESDLSGLPFNKTQGSLIWLVKKYIKDGLSKSKINLLVEELNYENNSNIKINWKTKEVFGDKITGTDDILKTFDHNEQRIREVVSYLNNKFGNKITVVFVDEDTWLRDDRLYDGSNSCIIGNTVYLRKSRMTTEIAAEEMLHTLIHGMKCGSGEFGNKQLFDKLFERAKHQFPKLWNEIQRVYKYNHDEELVTQVLARYFNRDFDKRDTYKLEDLIEKFKNWFVKLFKNILEEFAGTYYANVSDINPLLDFQDISDMLLAKNLKFDIQTIIEIHTTSTSNKISNALSEDQILHNISQRQQAAQDEAERLITRMNVLHKQYEKIKDKTPSQERLANQIFETYNKLKQHRDISAIGIALEQAKLTLGQYDESTGGPVLVSSIYKFLYDHAANDFDGVSALNIVDMYRNSIKFYKDLIENIPSDLIIDLSAEDKKSIELLKNLIDSHIMPLIVKAMMTIGDKIVDEVVDSEVFSSEENKDDMKKVAKDWLHKNLMYGDITAATSYLYNYSYSSNPIIKQAFHLIQEAELKTLEEVHHIAPRLMKAYQKANSGTRSFTPGWLSMMMEFDDEGKPTGNFIRDINYGLYEKDLINFIKGLNLEWLDTYGYTYITDENGIIVNSLTGEYAEDQEWGPNGEKPNYIQYLERIEHFKGDQNTYGDSRVHRRYTVKYYLERMSRPYDGTIDPESIDFIGTRFNHGLSPKTLSRYNYYQTNINYYLNKCQDQETGFVYPERLSYDDLLSLDKWQVRMDEFKSVFNPDGSYKDGEDLKMAYEVRAWQKWIGQHTDSVVLLDEFNKLLAEIKLESVDTNNPRLYRDFVRYNSHVGINPDYIKQTVGTLNSLKDDTDLSYRGKILRSVLQDMVKNPAIFGRELKNMINNPLFWLRCKASDLAVEDANTPDNTSGWSKEMVEQYENSFYQKEILYIDPQGFYIDENGNKINPNNPDAKVLEDAGKLLTFRQYLINTYTNEALQKGFVEGLIDESTGLNIDFSGLTESLIRKQIISLLSYSKRIYDEDGEITDIVYEPLTIFSILSPTQDQFFNLRTQRTEPTVILVGQQRFSDSNSAFVDHNYNPREGVAEKPDMFYDNGRYDNTSNFELMLEDDAVKDLYYLLIDTMAEMQLIYSTNRKFNYKLPQINAHSAALFSRLIKRGYTEKSLRAIWDSMTTIEENDDRLRTKLDFFVGPDGEVANDVPLKFIRDLKNKEDLSTDLVSSVIMFVDMALNYKNKQEIDSKLKILRYNLDKNIRDVYEKRLKPRSELQAKDDKNSIKMFDSMMDTSMYGNKFGGATEEGPSKTRVALHKTADAFLSLESTAMLGLNVFSMSVGFSDSITRIFSESAAGKYMTIGDCLWALGKVLYHTPACIRNMFNPLANNKLTALMQMNGISKGTFSTYTKTDWGRGRKFLTNILMGGWSMLDWMANALLMTAFYHNCRFYDGNVVPKGFYTKYELQQAFIKAGHSKSEANLVHDGYSILHLGYNKDTFKTYTVLEMDEKGNMLDKKIRGGLSLWDAYEFAPYVKDSDGNVQKLVGEVVVRKEYEQYVTQRIKTNIATKTKKRGGLYNGMNPDNDVPRWKRDVIGRLAGALRTWIILQYQHLAAGGTDNLEVEFLKETKYYTSRAGTKGKPEYKKQKFTDEQESRRMAWDYETGTPLDQIVVSLWRSLKTMFRMSKQALLHKPRTAKLSEIEKYAWKDAIIFTAMLSMMMVGWTYIHDDARLVKKPKNRKLAGPASMLNPVDYYEYIKDVYIPNQYWKLAVDDIYFRTVEAKISSVNIQQVLDIVNALTALKSGLDNQLGIIKLSSDVINEEDVNGIINQGGYKFYTKGEKALYKAIGPVNNLHTFLTYYGATGNLRWYTNQFGTFYRAFGYDFKKKDKEKKSQKSEGGFSQGGFSSGGFSQGGFSR